MPSDNGPEVCYARQSKILQYDITVAILSLKNLLSTYSAIRVDKF